MQSMVQLANLETISKILTHPTWDLLVVFFFVAAGFFYGITSGKAKLISALFSLYISGLIFENFSYLDFLTKGRTLIETFLFRGSAFAILVILLTFLFNRVLSRDYVSGTREWWKVFFLSFLETGLLMSFIFQLLPAKELFNFSPIVQNIFASSRAFFWWLTLPLVALFFIARKR
ncbi:MAG: hypothetical protein V1877_00170 [Candidatus Tagabacteria bacterium]